MTQSPRKSRTQDEITENLKRAFQEVEKQEVPDRFKLLLQQLKTQDADPNAEGPADE